MMRLSKTSIRLLTLVVPIVVASSSFAFEVQTCEEAGTGLASLVEPIEANHLRLYDGKASVFNVDTIEPACCSSGVAVVIPDNSDPSGGSLCMAVIGLGSVDVVRAKRTYDPARGLLLEMKTQEFDGASGLRTGPVLRLRLDLKTSRVLIDTQ